MLVNRFLQGLKQSARTLPDKTKRKNFSLLTIRRHRSIHHGPEMWRFSTHRLSEIVRREAVERKNRFAAPRHRNPKTISHPALRKMPPGRRMQPGACQRRCRQALFYVSWGGEVLWWGEREDEALTDKYKSHWRLTDTAIRRKHHYIPANRCLGDAGCPMPGSTAGKPHFTRWMEPFPPRFRSHGQGDACGITSSARSSQKSAQPLIKALYRECAIAPFIDRPFQNRRL